ncbi:hypothetical protein ACKLTP_19105, partial [Paenarthrobacter ureafaciens]
SEVAGRYRPTAVHLTEQMFDDFTFGTDDLEDFKATTGLKDWPRNSSRSLHAPDAHHPTWPPEAVADLLRNVPAAVVP